MVLARLAPKVPYFCSRVEGVKRKPSSGVPTSPKIPPVLNPLKILKMVSGPASWCAGLVRVDWVRYWPRRLRMKGLELPKVAVSLKPRRRLRSPRLVRVEGRAVERERGFVLLT